MKKKLKEIPVFESEDQEREFWGRSDSSDYVDWGNAEQVIFTKLKPATRTTTSMSRSSSWAVPRTFQAHIFLISSKIQHIIPANPSVSADPCIADRRGEIHKGLPI